MKPCDCGYGSGFYHRAPDALHEYNPEASECRALADWYSDRRPRVSFYHSLQGAYVELHDPVTDDYEKFLYRDHDGRQGAMAAAAARAVEISRQGVLL